MRSDPAQVEARRNDFAVVDLTGGTTLGDVAGGGVELFTEGLLDRTARDLLRQLDHASCVVEDLHSLDSGDLAEEPAAARVHEHGVALGLEQLERAHDLGGVERTVAPFLQKPFDAHVGAVEDDVDVVVARAPGVAQRQPSLFFED